MDAILFILFLILIGLSIGNLLGWAATTGCRRFNWRIFLGGTVYRAWRDRADARP